MTVWCQKCVYYDGTTTNKWNAKNLALSDLPSTIVNTGAVGTTNALGAPVVVTTTPTAGQALAYTTASGGQWIPTTISGTLSLQGLTNDVTITEGTTPLASTNTNTVLCWTGTKWGAKALTLADLPSSIVNSGTTTNGMYAPVVITTTPAANQVLSYSTTSGGQWIPTTVSAASSIATCTDVQISEGTAPLTTTTSNAPVLYWNTTSTKTTSGGWEAKILAINNNDFADFVINTSGLANNQMLQYNTTGTKWVNWNPTY